MRRAMWRSAALTTGLVWLLFASVFWVFGDLTPAGICGAISGTGFLLYGWFAFSDHWDEIHYQAEAFTPDGDEEEVAA